MAGSRQFAEVRECIGGWEAYARVGMRSGPWSTRREAEAVADRWNGAAGGWPAARNGVRS